MRRFLILATAIAALALVPGAAAATGYYSFTPLGSFTPAAINHDGMVVGAPNAVWSPDHGFGYLPLTAPSDVNDAGVVVGVMDSHAYSWTESGGLVDLGPGQALAISNNGLIVGTDFRHPILWTAGGKVDLFGDSADTGVATGVGDSGRVVGYGRTEAGSAYIFTWTDSEGLTVLVDAGAMRGTPIAYVNDHGDVAGMVGDTPTSSGFFWSPATGVVQLGAILAGGDTSVTGIGSDGTVFGSTRTGDGFPPAAHAYTWTLARGFVDLGTLGGQRSFASGIASDGSVGGWSMQSGGFAFPTHAFVWTPRYGILDLGFSPTESSMAYAMNDQGWLVGTSGGYAYLWKPRDVTPPVITVPPDITAEATSADGAVVTFTVTAVDNLDPSPVITCMHESGSLFPLGDTEVWCYARDSLGNTSLGIFTVHVVDTTAPALVVPIGLTVDATSPAGAAVTFAASATDLVDGSPVVACTPSSGTTFPIGDTTVECVARDAAGNEATGSFGIHVRGADEQLSLLAARVQALDVPFGTQTSLLVKLDTGQLPAFVHEVEAQAGKAIPTADAAELVERVERIQAVLD